MSSSVGSRESGSVAPRGAPWWPVAWWVLGWAILGFASGGHAADAPKDAAPEVEASEAEPRPRFASPPPPVGVRRPEPLEGDRMRLGYAFERTRFREIQVGVSDRTQSEVLSGIYQQAPTALDITRHTFELAYAPHPRVTLIVNIPFLEKELERVDVSFRRRSDHTDGVGDIEFAVLVPFIKKGRESTHVHIGVKAPTGSIRRSEGMRRLPYDLQIGNGTWDLEWGWTYRGERDRFSWGAQLFGIHPVGTNGLHYRAGSRFEASMWSALRLFRGLSASIRLGAEKKNNIRGFDRDLDLAADGPSAADKARGGVVVEVRPGLSFEVPELAHQRLSLEFGIPIHQDLHGPQLSRDWSFKVGWQWVY